jgi:hypothetical protein
MALELREEKVLFLRVASAVSRALEGEHRTGTVHGLLLPSLHHV